MRAPSRVCRIRSRLTAAAIACCLASAGCRPPAGPVAPAGADSGCGLAATRISVIQGIGNASPLKGSAAVVEAVVTADYVGDDRLGGFFVQQEPAETDGDERTSEALFIATSQAVVAGDRVRVTGTVVETGGRTGLGAIKQFSVCARGRPMPPAVPIALPRTGEQTFERLENMRVALAGEAVITDVYPLWRFGEFSISSARHPAPTQAAAPGRPARGHGRGHALDELVVDDGVTRQNAEVAHLGQDDRRPFAADNPIRAGMTIRALGGVLHETRAGWRLLPTQRYRIDERANARSESPEPVGGSLRVATFNLLNYFTTPADAGPVCGPARNQACRGAGTAREFGRQTAKTVAALRAIEADIVALVELENDAGAALAALVDALNQAATAGEYALIDTGVIGRDVIKPGLIYRPARVAPAGVHALLTRQADARFHDGLNRPVLAQTFCDRLSGVHITLAVAHLKSKATPCDAIGDPDTGDGQGHCNRTRRDAVAALADWLESDPTGAGVEYQIVLGDLNAYAQEDPIRVLREAGFSDLAARFAGDDAYTYNYHGRPGQLDYIWVNQALVPHATGATAWHINADEAPALDYHEDFGKPAGYYRPDPYRSSDHDPVIAGLDFSRPAPRGTPATCP